MKHEKARARQIHVIFLCIDIVLIVMIFSLEGTLYLEFIKVSGHDHNDESTFILFLISYGLPIFLESIFFFVLAISACFIASLVS